MENLRTLGDLGLLHFVGPTTVPDAQMVTPGLVLQRQMEVPWFTISGSMDSTTHLRAVSCRKPEPEKAMWSQDAGESDLAGCDAL